MAEIQVGQAEEVVVIGKQGIETYAAAVHCKRLVEAPQAREVLVAQQHQDVVVGVRIRRTSPQAFSGIEIPLHHTIVDQDLVCGRVDRILLEHAYGAIHPRLRIVEITPREPCTGRRVVGIVFQCTLQELPAFDHFARIEGEDQFEPPAKLLPRPDVRSPVALPLEECRRITS